jgi:hypothetical protein
VARSAGGARRQAHGAGLLLSALAASCASQGEPPGGPPRTIPPQIVRVAPESGAIVPDWHGDAVIAFDEVIDEMPASPGARGTITGLAKQVILSPVAGEVKVSWHRTAIHVRPAEGWRPERVYRLELLPGITDLRRNVLKRGTTVVFSTGPAIPATALTGTALLWVEQRALAGAVIRAVALPDTLAYVTVADSAGGFRLGALPPGRYQIWAIQDQNANRLPDRREAFDTVTVTLDSSATAVLWAFVHDTVGPRVKSVDPVDTVTLRITFTEALDPRRPVDTLAVRVLALPDSTPVAVAAVLTPPQFDSLQARARAAADSLRRLRDTTARRDTAALRRPPPPPLRRDTATADTTALRRLLRQRPVPYDRLVVRTAAPLAPGGTYLVRVRGATNLTGAAADAQGVVAVPAAKPASRDSTRSP